jgi:NAD(P)-dependent dehydrogenase (short-subunit alcohol dehydrogenase family)
LQTVLITGANRGLGLEFARQYANDGFKVIATCREERSAEALRSCIEKIEVHLLDVTDNEEVKLLAKKLSNTRLDILIANAGVMSKNPEENPEEIPAAAWIESFKVNTIAPLMFARAFVRQMVNGDRGKIVAISSWISSIQSNTTGGYYSYRASKAALNAVWRSFAIDNPQIITALLSPGPLRTDMTKYNEVRWKNLPEPAENIAKLRAIIGNLKPNDSGCFFHFNGSKLPW